MDNSSDLEKDWNDFLKSIQDDREFEDVWLFDDDDLLFLENDDDDYEGDDEESV